MLASTRMYREMGVGMLVFINYINVYGNGRLVIWHRRKLRSR